VSSQGRVRGILSCVHRASDCSVTVVSRLHTHVRTKNQPASQQITSCRPAARQQPNLTQKRRLSGTRKIHGTSSDPFTPLFNSGLLRNPELREELATCSLSDLSLPALCGDPAQPSAAPDAPAHYSHPPQSLRRFFKLAVRPTLGLRLLIIYPGAPSSSGHTASTIDRGYFCNAI